MKPAPFLGWWQLDSNDIMKRGDFFTTHRAAGPLPDVARAPADDESFDNYDNVFGYHGHPESYGHRYDPYFACFRHWSRINDEEMKAGAADVKLRRIPKSVGDIHYAEPLDLP